MERYFIRWRTKGKELSTTIEDRAEAEALRDAINNDDGSEILEYTKKG